jgi:hypothetical protein
MIPDALEPRDHIIIDEIIRKGIPLLDLKNLLPRLKTHISWIQIQWADALAQST